LSSDETNVDLDSLHLDGRFVKLVSGGANPMRREGGEFVKRFREVMLFRDPPDHSRLRGLVARAFTPRRVELLEGRIGELADEMLDRAAKAGGST